jgi:blocked-early-in-transport protein 1
LDPSSTRAAPSLRDRSALLGSTPTSSGRSSPFGGIYPQGGQHMNGQRYADDLEGQNDEALEGLSAKVKLLKDVSEFYLFTQLVSNSQ